MTFDEWSKLYGNPIKYNDTIPPKPSTTNTWMPYKVTTGGTYTIDLPEGYKIDLEHLYSGLNPINVEIDMAVSSGCNHEYINVGFHFDKFVCKKCNKDK